MTHVYIGVMRMVDTPLIINSAELHSASLNFALESCTMFFHDVITYSLCIINDQSGRIVGIAKIEQI